MICFRSIRHYLPPDMGLNHIGSKRRCSSALGWWFAGLKLLGHIPVGVRGTTRSDRWGGFCDESQIRMIARPGQLLPSGGRTPALRALQKMCDRWAALALSWGPAGSVGFELATGRRVTNEESDLD